jgi:Family of unknown function (DUF5302)
MAVDQTKPAGEHADGEPQPDSAPSDSAPSDSAPSDSAPSDSAQPDSAGPDLDEMKRKFRAALDRKRGEHATANADGTQETGKVHGSHGPAASRRSFRRKSGG